MKKFEIEVELLSETIFGSGETESNSVDIEVLKDSVGIPYLKGKTFKGKLREEVEAVAKIIKEFSGKEYTQYVIDLFGEEEVYNHGTLKFSSCKINENIEKNLKYAVENNIISKEQVLSSFTEVRSFTSIEEDGIAKKGSLRQGRVIRKSLKYYVQITTTRELNIIEKGLLAAGVKALRNIGAMESRGKGRIESKLLEDGKDITKFYIEALEKEVG